MADTTDDDLWGAFQSGALPASDWKHHAHLRIAWMYCRRHSIDHETATRVWLALVAAAIRKTPDLDTSTKFLAVYAEDLVTVAPLCHCTRQRLVSAEARAEFVPPDLVPLP